MKFTLNEIKKKADNSTFIFDEMVDVSEVKTINEEIREIKPVRVKGNCVIDGSKLIFSLTISGEMILPCARTLADVTYPFSVKEIEVFSESPYYGEEDEEEIHPIQGGIVDLTPCIHENILLAVPFRVFSDDPEVLNQALVKGNGWELALEDDEKNTEKREQKIDPRLLKLKSFFDESKKD